MNETAAREYVVTDRVAVVTEALLCSPDGLTIVDVARLTGLTYWGAAALVSRICRSLPVYTERGRDPRGRWRAVRFFHLYAATQRRR